MEKRANSAWKHLMPILGGKKQPWQASNKGAGRVVRETVSSTENTGKRPGSTAVVRTLMSCP